MLDALSFSCGLMKGSSRTDPRSIIVVRSCKNEEDATIALDKCDGIFDVLLCQVRLFFMLSEYIANT